jgi:chromosome partitioning protein
MRTLAIANQKGGAGKTVTARNLGSLVAAAGFRCLLVDADPQGSLTQTCGINGVESHSLAEVIGGAQPGKLPMAKAILALAGNLSICTADIALAGAELGLVSRFGREVVLKKALASVAPNFDLAIIDCPPSLGLLTVAALVAADAVLIPTLPSELDLRGLRLFLQTLEQIKELNPTLETLGVLITQYDNRFTMHKQALETLRAADLPIMPVMIGRSVKVAQAAGEGKTIGDLAPTNPQAAAYKQLSEEIIQWIRNA